MFSVLQIGQFSKLSPVLLHSTHSTRCPQLQNKILDGLVRHITHLSSKDYYDLLVKVPDLIKDKIKEIEDFLKKAKKVGINT